MSSILTGKVPIWIDAGYRFTPQLFAGGFFQYAFGGLSNELCPSGNGLSCSASTMRLGVEGICRLTRGAGLEPWVGAGIGYEWTTLSASTGGASADRVLRGFEYGNVQIGADYRVSARFAVGPYLALSLGRYGSTTLTQSSGDGVQTTSQDIPGSDEAFHAWFQFGLKGTLDL